MRRSQHHEHTFKVMAVILSPLNNASKQGVCLGVKAKFTSSYVRTTTFHTLAVNESHNSKKSEIYFQILSKAPNAVFCLVFKSGPGIEIGY